MQYGIFRPIVAAFLLFTIVLSCCGGQNVSLCFYGKIVDQNSNAVPSVKIKAIVRHWRQPEVMGLYLGAKEIEISAKSDKAGRFKLQGPSGDCFQIESMQKSGYEAELEAGGYDAIGGTAQNPIIFKMYPTNLHENLIGGKKSFDVVPDGRRYFINLIDGTIAESGSGDLMVWIKDAEKPVQGQLYDWECGVDVINGGLLQDGSYYRSVAPSEGYIPAFKVQKKTKGGQGGDTGEKRFYLKLKYGRVYGKMSIELIAPFNDKIPGLIRLSYAINPSGSKILR